MYSSPLVNYLLETVPYILTLEYPLVSNSQIITHFWPRDTPETYPLKLESSSYNIYVSIYIYNYIYNV